MRRVGHLFERVADFAALRRAFGDATRGRHGSDAAARLFVQLEPALLELEAELLDGRYRPGRPVSFAIRDPKPRRITVPPLRDRVVHHALIGATAPVLERGMDPDSYGCRVGRGTSAALDRAQQLARRHAWCLRSDVSRFFDSIDHARLMAQLERLFKDRRLLWLFAIILHAGNPSGVGLPLGALTSQWCANLYLTPLDRFVRRQRAAKGYVRYMDDVLIFGDAATDLRAFATELAEEAKRGFGLTLKARATQVHRCRDGVPFLGFRLRPHRRQVRRERWRRFTQRVTQLEHDYRRGHSSLDELAQRARSVFAHVDHADSRGLRRAWLATRSPVEW